jgi:hypothetical protein
VNEIGEGLEKVKNVEWKSEVSGEGRVEKNVIDERGDEEEVFLCLIFNGEGVNGKQTERHLVRNKIEKKDDGKNDDGDGPSTQSTNPSEGEGNVGFILLIVFLSICLIGAIAFILFILIRYKRFRRQVEEEKMKRSEITTKENGMELKEKESVGNSDEASSM